MNFFKKAMVGIDFHDRVVQFVDLKRYGKKVELRAFNRVVIPQGLIVDGRIQDAEALKPLVRAMFEKANPVPVDAKKAVFMLPSKHVFTHIFKFPAMFSLKDIRKALVFEVENVIPYAIEDMVWDCFVLDKTVDPSSSKDQSQTVLFAGVPKVVSEEYVNFFMSLDIKPLIFGIHVNALLMALQSDLSARSTSLVVDLDPYATNYLVLKHGLVQYFLSSSEGMEHFFVQMGAQLGMEEEACLEAWMRGELKPEQMQSVNQFVEEKFQQARRIQLENEEDPHVGPIENIYLTGEYASVSSLFQRMSTIFSDKKVLVGDPKYNMVVKDNRFLERYQKDGSQIPFSVFFTNAIGVASQFLLSEGGVNLLPDALKRNFFLEKLEKVMMFTAFGMAALTLVLSSWLLILQQDHSHERDILEIEKARIDNTLYGTRYQEIYAALNLFNQEINQLSSVDQVLFSVPKTLDALMQTVSDGIQITSYHFKDADLAIELTGIADTRETLLELQHRLDGVEFVDEVLAPLSNYDEKDNVSFSIKIKLNFQKLPSYDGSEKK